MCLLVYMISDYLKSMVLSRHCHEDSKFLETVTVESTVVTVTILLKKPTTILAKSNSNSAYLFTFTFYKSYEICIVFMTVL